MARRKRDTAPIEDDAFEELEDATDDELEEVDDEEPAPKPTRRRGTKAAATTAPAKRAESDGDSGYNTAWLAEYVTETTGTAVDSRGLRMLLRKMASAGELERVVGEDRGRYSFPKGANDPTVKAVLRKVKSGELAAAKREGLDKVKSKAAAAKTAEEPAAPAKRTRAKATTAKAEAPAKAAPRRRRAAAAAE